MLFGILFFFLLSVFGAVAEDACPPIEIVKYAELYTSPHLHSCQKVSAGFSLVPPMGYPTDPQVKAMCASDACVALNKDVLELKPADCFLSFAGAKLNVFKMAHSFEDGCAKHHEEDKYRPTPKPSKETEYHPTPKPTKYEAQSTPKTTMEEYHPTPKQTKYYQSPKSTESGKNYPTKYYPTTKPTDDKYYTPKPMDTEGHYKPEESVFVKCDHAENACLKRSARKKIAKDAEAKPPMNGTAFELFPMPNTTYKATVSSKA
ncbi:Beta-elicitin cinnamomin [Phytophthora citrophthora]|uniref:Beta-elicitin cinnamomin n=1 Tax=Phytophthora citrophthora TaxID=4793 RepID=A0AAD9H0B1_9STRA|nr:Beta-elicitin cinnamomin [Phytophthora citrophthora]